jgi:hypothetical protein
MPAAEYLTLAPPLVEAGKFNELVKAGQTVSFTLSSSDNSFAVFITNVVRKPMSEKDHHSVQFLSAGRAKCCKKSHGGG